MRRACPPHVPTRHFENIDGDTSCTDELRDEAITALAASADPVDAARRFSEWCRATRDAGRVPEHSIRFEDRERVGRLRYRATYDSHLADILRLNSDIGGADESDIEELVKWIVGEPSALEDDAARFLFEQLVADQPIEVGTAWFFRGGGHGPRPFVDEEPGCLPWRLGLRYVCSGTEYVGFDVDAARIGNPRLATFVDVQWDYHAVWRPGGRTEPLSGTPDACKNEGLEELLATPPSFRDVHLPTVHIVTS